MINKSYLIEQNINLLDKKIFLFFGENLGLKNELKDKIILQNKESEIISFLQEEILKKEELLYNEIYNISLFEKKKIFFIDQVNDKLLNIIKEIEPRIDSQKIYLFSEILDKKSKIRDYFEKSKIHGAVACYADNELSIKKIILNKLKGFRGLSSENINLLVNNINLDRVKLNNELNKILNFFTNKELNNEKLEILLDIKINNDFNNLKDEALNGNKSNTNKLLGETIIEPEKNIFYLTLINQRLNKLNDILTLSKNVNLEDAINKLKPPIFWKDKPNFINQVKKWNQKKIKKILKKTYNIEVKIKTNSTINKNILLKKLLVDVCNMASIS